MYFRLVVILVICFFHNVLCQNDSCDLKGNYPPNEFDIWIGRPSEVSSCFNEIPFNESIRSKTLDVLNTLWSLYSFSDTSQTTIPPFNITVNWPSEIINIKSKDYTSDYIFQIDVVQLLKKLNDAHTMYIAPAGYRTFSTVRPFTLSSALVNGTQYIFAEKGLIDSELYKQFCNCELDINEYYGKRITKIGGLDVFSFLQLEINEVGQYYDSNVRFNELLSSYFPFQLKSSQYHIPLNDIESYQFEDVDRPINFPILALNLAPTNNKQDIIDRNLNLSSIEENSRNEFSILDLLQNSIHDSKNENVTNLINNFLLRYPLDYLKTLPPHMIQSKISEGISLYFKSRSSNKDPETTIMTSIISNNNTSNITFPVGEPSYLVTYHKGDGIYHLSYEDTTVLKVESFYPKIENIERYMNIARGITKNRMRNGLNKNLIVDVSGNGGGYVCLSYWLLSFLVKDWHEGSYTGDDHLYYPYDFKMSEFTDDLMFEDFFADEVFINPSNKKPYGNNTWYEPVTKKYGSLESNYTKPFYLGECEELFDVSKNQWVFEKIIVLTDGRCGSACSYFLSKLRLSDKVRVVSYGGIWGGQEMSTSQFAGGAVFGWNDFIDDLKERDIKKDWIQHFPTTSLASFNFFQTFVDLNMTTPLQYMKIPADFHVPLWKALYDPSFDVGKQNLADLYEATQIFFANVTAGLPGKNTGLTTLQTLLIVIGVLMGVALVLFIVWVILKRVKYRTF